MMKGMKAHLGFYPVLAIHTKDGRIALDKDREKPPGSAICLPFQCWIIRGKIVSPLPVSGTTLAMDRTRLYVRVGSPIPNLTDVKIQFDFCVDAHCFSDLYAKTVSTTQFQGQPCQVLKITSMDEADRAIIQKWMDEAGDDFS
jgi:hypothetical protein